MKKIIFLNIMLIIALFSCDTENEAIIQNEPVTVSKGADLFEILSVETFDTIVDNEVVDGTALKGCDNTSTNTPRYCLKTPIIAAKNMRAGNMKIFKVEDGIFKIVFKLKRDWRAYKSHFYIGACDQIPTNRRNNPKIGLFPITDTYACGKRKIVITIASTTDIFCVAAHAEVAKLNWCRTETAWAEGDRFNNKNWAMYVPFDGTDCAPLRPGEPDDNTGTDGSGTDGSGTDGSGTDGSGTDGSGTDGSGTDGSGTDGSGTDGSGTDGSGTDGSGTDGSGTDGSGTDGSGTDGSGTDGSGTDGSGTDGSGTDGSGTDGSGTDGSGTDGDMGGGSTGSGTDSSGGEAGEGDAGGSTGSGTDGSGTDDTDQTGTGTDGTGSEAGEGDSSGGSTGSGTGSSGSDDTDQSGTGSDGTSPGSE